MKWEENCNSRLRYQELRCTVSLWGNWGHVQICTNLTYTAELSCSKWCRWGYRKRHRWFHCLSHPTLLWKKKKKQWEEVREWRRWCIAAVALASVDAKHQKRCHPWTTGRQLTSFSRFSHSASVTLAWCRSPTVLGTGLPSAIAFAYPPVWKFLPQAIPMNCSHIHWDFYSSIKLIREASLGHADCNSNPGDMLFSKHI